MSATERSTERSPPRSIDNLTRITTAKGNYLIVLDKDDLSGHFRNTRTFESGNLWLAITADKSLELDCFSAQNGLPREVKEALAANFIDVSEFQ
jgi:hypothetical protein